MGGTKHSLSPGDKIRGGHVSPSPTKLHPCKWDCSYLSEIMTNICKFLRGQILFPPTVPLKLTCTFDSPCAEDKKLCHRRIVCREYVITITIIHWFPVVLLHTSHLMIVLPKQGLLLCHRDKLSVTLIC